MKNYFPTVLAKGIAFCNRTEELKHILHNISIGAPTLLISPRRYGKTSLALRAAEKSKCYYAHVDLYKALNEQEVAEYILNGIGRLLGKIEKTPVKLMKLATSFFGSFQLKLGFSDYDISVELTRKSKKPAELILSALEHLDKFISKNVRTKKAILFLDEFQVLSEICQDNSIEAAIREAMQKAECLHYMFAGSNRHLIERMFNDDSRPFFNSCDQISLKRISMGHYIQQIKKAAKERWKEGLSSESLDMIFKKTEFHPYYVNKLCAILFRADLPAGVDEVEEAWNLYRDENISRVQQEVSLLKLNQRRLLMNIAIDKTVKNPYGNEYSRKCGISPTSIHRAMTFLLERDYVYIDSSAEYCILDPLIGDVLAL